MSPRAARMAPFSPVDTMRPGLSRMRIRGPVAPFVAGIARAIGGHSIRHKNFKAAVRRILIEG